VQRLLWDAAAVSMGRGSGAKLRQLLLRAAAA